MTIKKSPGRYRDLLKNFYGYPPSIITQLKLFPCKQDIIIGIIKAAKSRGKIYHQ